MYWLYEWKVFSLTNFTRQNVRERTTILNALKWNVWKCSSNAAHRWPWVPFRANVCVHRFQKGNTFAHTLLCLRLSLLQSLKHTEEACKLILNLSLKMHQTNSYAGLLRECFWNASTRFESRFCMRVYVLHCLPSSYLTSHLLWSIRVHCGSSDEFEYNGGKHWKQFSFKALHVVKVPRLNCSVFHLHCLASDVGQTKSEQISRKCLIRLCVKEFSCHYSISFA